jgi:hypothetical protein
MKNRKNDVLRFEMKSHPKTAIQRNRQNRPKRNRSTARAGSRREGSAELQSRKIHKQERAHKFTMQQLSTGGKPACNTSHLKPSATSSKP